MKLSPEELLQQIAQLIYDKKGMNIVAIDVKGISTITDYLLIAEGAVDRHVNGLSREVVDFFKKKGITPLSVVGDDAGDWVVLDYVEIMIHIFLPELRQKYALEELWNKGLIVDLHIDISNREAEERWLEDES